jgi:hypothetical protein
MAGPLLYWFSEGAQNFTGTATVIPSPSSGQVIILREIELYCNSLTGTVITFSSGASLQTIVYYNYDPLSDSPNWYQWKGHYSIQSFDSIVATVTGGGGFDISLSFIVLPAIPVADL